MNHGSNAVSRSLVQETTTNFDKCDLNVWAKVCIVAFLVWRTETNRKLIGLHKGVVDLCHTLERHMAAPNIVDAALSALWSLSVDGM